MVHGSLSKPQLYPVKISRNVISFHYVSEMESLLYYLLSSKSSTEVIKVQESRMIKEKGTTIVPLKSPFDHRKIDHNDDLKYDLNIMTFQKLLLLWPKTSKDIGHYSRRIKGSNESMKLLYFLNKHVKIGY
jgi:hypothetical protein